MNRNLILSSLLLATQAYAVNGANDAPVIAPGAATPVQISPYLPPPPLPGGTAATPAQTLPIDTPAAAPQPGADSEKSSDQQSPMEMIAPMLQGMGGGSGGGFTSGDGRGGDRAVGGGSGGSYPSSGTSSSLDYLPESGPMRDGRNMSYISGCSSAPGKWQFAYASPRAKCDTKLAVDGSFANFIDKNLNRCVSTAVGANVSGGKVIHAGTIGDARHQRTGSLHNVGLAMDLKAIQVNGKLFSYDSKDAASQTFFSKFRECWGAAANSERLHCLGRSRSGKAPGTIGDEDSRHRHHLHLSLPLCPNEARAKGLYLTLRMILSWLWPRAHAEEGVTVRMKRIKIGAHRAELIIRDQHGEPVDADQRFTVKLICAGDAKPKVLLEDAGGCEFVSFKRNGEALELRYLTSQMRDGELICRELEIKPLKADCPASK